MNDKTGSPSEYRWPLTAPESYVLLHGHSANGAEVFKLALLELVARKVLELSQVKEKGFLGIIKTTAVLTHGTKKGKPPSSRALASVMQLYRSLPARQFDDGSVGVAVTDLAKEAQSQYISLTKYMEMEVWPTMSKQGLYTHKEQRVLGIFPASRWVLTDLGTRRRADLEWRLSQAKAEFGGWVNHDPSRAVAFVTLSGSALLLMNPIFQDVQQLVNRGNVGDGGAFGDGSGSTTSIMTVDTGDDQPDFGELAPESFDLDLGGLDFGAFDFASLDGIDSAFSAIDGGVSDAGGDGGGNGGGGNGGGD